MEPQINEGDLITVTQRCTRILKPKFFERLLAEDSLRPKA